MRRGWRAGGAAAVVTAVLAGCGGSSGSSAPAAPTPPSASVASPASTVLPHRGGLVGAIDAARLTAVCQNVRLAETAVEGELPGSAVGSAIKGVIQALRQPPVDPALVRLASDWLALERRSGDRATVNRMTAFCRTEGG